MQYLDPTSAVPERVRIAFDALTESVLIIEAQGRIVLTNAALRNLEGGPVGRSAVTGTQALAGDAGERRPGAVAASVPGWRTFDPLPIIGNPAPTEPAPRLSHQGT